MGALISDVANRNACLAAEGVTDEKGATESDKGHVDLCDSALVCGAISVSSELGSDAGIVPLLHIWLLALRDAFFLQPAASGPPQRSSLIVKCLPLGRQPCRALLLHRTPIAKSAMYAIKRPPVVTAFTRIPFNALQRAPQAHPDPRRGWWACRQLCCGRPCSRRLPSRAHGGL